MIALNMDPDNISPPNPSYTAAETARLLRTMGFNWLDIEFVLELAPHEPRNGHMYYKHEVLERFVGRAFWLTETPLPEPHTAPPLPAAA